jgi:hypothetical protein
MVPGQEQEREMEQVAGKHGFDGKCKPGGIGAHVSHETFSVSVFKWLAKPLSSKGGLKKGSVLARVKGSTSNAEAVYAEARRLCAEFDSGRLPTLTKSGRPKTITV